MTKAKTKTEPVVEPCEPDDKVQHGVPADEPTDEPVATPFETNAGVWDEYQTSMGALNAAKAQRRSDYEYNTQEQGRPAYGPGSVAPDDLMDVTYEEFGYWQYPGNLAALKADPEHGDGLGADIPPSHYVVLIDGYATYSTGAWSAHDGPDYVPAP